MKDLHKLYTFINKAVILMLILGAAFHPGVNYFFTVAVGYWGLCKLNQANDTLISTVGFSVTQTQVREHVRECWKQVRFPFLAFLIMVIITSTMTFYTADFPTSRGDRLPPEFVGLGFVYMMVVAWIGITWYDIGRFFREVAKVPGYKT